MIPGAPLLLAFAQVKRPEIPPGVVDRIESIGKDVDSLRHRVTALQEFVAPGAGTPIDRLDVFHGYVPVFVVAFLVTLFATPLIRRLALANGIIDRPTEARKIHRLPVAYLGGVAVFLGLMAGIFYSYIATVRPGMMEFHTTGYLDSDGEHFAVPISVIFGMTLIMLVGLIDDVAGIAPRLKIGGQLIAAAALAASDVGVKVAAGLIVPAAKTFGIGTTYVNDFETILVQIPLPPVFSGTGHFTIDIVYWTGTAIIALFVLGACNASNLIDGLDGLLSGVTGIAAFGLCVIALGMAVIDDGPRDSPRIVLCLALLGACLGFLPHNFNPATIFLGDSGSLLLGFCSIVIILMLGDRGQTQLVFAGLIIYAIPIIDTVLAIIRRKLAGKSISDADDQHLHHMLKRSLGVKGAVLTLYAIGAGFAVLGIAISLGRARVVYAIALVFAAFIAVTAIKIARRKQMEEQTVRHLSPTPPPRPKPPQGGPPSHRGDDRAAAARHAATK